MALWEYKVITSGKGGFASANTLESYLNQLGKDEWEIIDFRTDPINSLAFNGLVRRPTQREWTLEAAVAAAAKAEVEKLRTELMQKQHAGDVSASADASAGATAGDKAAGPDGLRQLRDTDRDHDPEALADEASHGADDWSADAFEDDIPLFFDAIKPHLRKNPSTPGQSVALNYLAKRWEQPEEDIHCAMQECGFVIPEHETDAPVYLEYEGDLYWVEKNNRGQFFLNTREKPRPRFRIAQGKPLDPADPAYVALAEEQAAIEVERAKRAAEQVAREAEAQARRAEREAQRLAAEQARRDQQAAREAAQAAAQVAREVAQAARDAARATAVAMHSAATHNETGVHVPVSEAPAAATASGDLPAGEALLDLIRPQMRRNRRGPGYSGSSAYLAKYLNVEESVLKTAIMDLGLVPTESPGVKDEPKLIGAFVYWVNKDANGGFWINGREAGPRDRELASPSVAGVEPGQAPPLTPSDAPAASLPDAAAPAPEGEPPIFRAVPRAMPPLAVTESAGTSPAPVVAAEPSAALEPSPTEGQPLAALRLLMKPNRSKSGMSGSFSFLAKAIGRDEPGLVAVLGAQGLVVPPETGEGEAESKPVFVESGGEIFWISRFGKDGSLWLNAKASKSVARKAAKPAEDKPARPRTKRRTAE